MGKRFAIHPGFVRSGHDKDEHYVGYAKLIKLYGIPQGKCIRWDDNQPDTFRDRVASDYHHLYPSWTGDYSLNEEGEEVRDA